MPQIADWCAVDIVDEQGNIQRLAVAHIDPARWYSAARARVMPTTFIIKARKMCAS